MIIQTASRFLILAVAALVAITPCIAQAQYPMKPIRLMIGYTAGGPADVISRSLAQSLSSRLGQPVIVENRPGADANIAMGIVARAAPDGYTLLLETSAISMNLSLYRTLPFNPVKDLAPVTLIGAAPFVIVVHSSVPATTLCEFVALAKTRKGELFYGSTASPLQLASAMFTSMAGVEMVRVPYKGAGAGVPALLAGDVQLLISSAGLLMPHIKSGGIRALAVTGMQRSPLLPDVPTANEACIPGYSASTWYGIFVPAATPRSIVDRLNSEVHKALDEPEMKARLSALGLQPTPTTPEGLGDFVRAESVKWGKVVEESNVHID